MQELTYDKTVELLDRAIAEKGEDYVYLPVTMIRDDDPETLCLYFNEDDTPGCIIGHVMHYLGVTPTRGIEGVSGSVALKDLGIKVDEPTAVLINNTQSKQDQGTPWGDAVSFGKYAAECHRLGRDV